MPLAPLIKNFLESLDLITTIPLSTKDNSPFEDLVDKPLEAVGALSLFFHAELYSARCQPSSLHECR